MSSELKSVVSETLQLFKQIIDKKIIDKKCINTNITYIKIKISDIENMDFFSECVKLDYRTIKEIFISFQLILFELSNAVISEYKSEFLIELRDIVQKIYLSLDTLNSLDETYEQQMVQYCERKKIDYFTQTTPEVQMGNKRKVIDCICEYSKTIYYKLFLANSRKTGFLYLSVIYHKISELVDKIFYTLKNINKENADNLQRDYMSIHKIILKYKLIFDEVVYNQLKHSLKSLKCMICELYEQIKTIQWTFQSLPKKIPIIELYGFITQSANKFKQIANLCINIYNDSNDQIIYKNFIKMCDDACIMLSVKTYKEFQSKKIVYSKVYQQLVQRSFDDENNSLYTYNDPTFHYMILNTTTNEWESNSTSQFPQLLKNDGEKELLYKQYIMDDRMFVVTYNCNNIMMKMIYYAIIMNNSRTQNPFNTSHTDYSVDKQCKNITENDIFNTENCKIYLEKLSNNFVDMKSYSNFNVVSNFSKVCDFITYINKHIYKLNIFIIPFVKGITVSNMVHIISIIKLMASIGAYYDPVSIFQAKEFEVEYPTTKYGYNLHGDHNKITIILQLFRKINFGSHV